jgi:hypothetical protein
MQPKKNNMTIDNKLKDTAIDGAAIPFDPDEAEELGAIPDDTPLEDVIAAAHDDEV